MILLTETAVDTAIHEWAKGERGKKEVDGYAMNKAICKAQLKQVFDKIDRIYDMEDKDLRLALAYLHQTLFEECDGN